MHRALLTSEQQIALAESIRSGETAAEEELVHLFSDRVALLAYMRTRDREAARDLAQDVMLAVVLAIRNGHLHDAQRLAAFVYGTARNLINNYLRSRGRLTRAETLDAADEIPFTRSELDYDERIALVRRALADLDGTDRNILLLTLVEGLKPGEIGVRLGLTSEVVRSRKSRALKKTIECVKRLSRI